MAKSPKATGEDLLADADASNGDEPALSARLTEILERMPADPGVYLMKDKKGRIVYVGKAASLRARVRSYFNRSGDTRAFVALLGRILGDIETVVTNNEKEALLLENNLIKQYQPRFNVKLVDDKNYLVLRLDPKANFPRLEVTRRIGKDGAKYFGPYHSASSCRSTLQVVNRHFKLRTCSDHVLASRRRPCLQYQIKRCDAPCVYPIPAEEYGKQVQDVALFLEGKDEELLDRLQGRMQAAAAAEEFEIAGAVRDQLRALERTLEEQRVVSSDLRDQDVVGLHREGTAVELVVLHIRNGKLLGRRNFSFGGQEYPTSEIVSSFVQLYFDSGVYVPDEVLLPVAVDDAASLAEWLSVRRDAGAPKVDVLMPQRGARKKLVELADKNARVVRSLPAAIAAKTPNRRWPSCKIGCRSRSSRGGSNVSIFRTSKAPPPSARWSCSSTASPPKRSTASSRSNRRATTISPPCTRCCRGAFAAASKPRPLIYP